MKKTRLKGGSLAGTYLIEPDEGGAFVRKEVSLVENREYGFQRWYSQLKRLQRYGDLFPGIFPRLLDYGMLGADAAFFDIEYVPDTVTVQEALLREPQAPQVAAVHAAFVAMLDRMHARKIPSTTSAMPLYIHEEIEVKIAACHENERFRALLSAPEIIFNGRAMRPLVHALDDLKALAAKLYRNADETFTHGNVTLENVLVQRGSGRIVFVDPYEENIIDSVLAEYSQVYQSSHAKYELYNAGTAHIDHNRISMKIPDAPGIDLFNGLFTDWVRSRHDDADFVIIRILEISQFARMLPFKMAVDPDKMLFFYGLASALWDELQHDL